MQLLELLMHHCNISVSEQGLPNSVIDKLRDITTAEAIEPSTMILYSLRQTIEAYIYDLEIPNIKYNIYMLLHPGTQKDVVDITEISEQPLNLLSDSLLLKYLLRIFSTIRWVKKYNYILLKYMPSVAETGWHKLAKLCRGKVIDAQTYETLVYPFDKFFNVGERAGYTENEVRKFLSNADSISVTDKKDGSIIIITNILGDILVHTSGAFITLQSEWAEQLLNTKYKTFINNIPTGYTYIFELIHPRNRIVVDYGDTFDLYLLAIRNLQTTQLQSYTYLESEANKYGFHITEQEAFTDYDSIINTSVNYEGVKKEGWVIRATSGDKEMIVKVKVPDYLILHDAKSITQTIKRISTLITTNMLDEYLALLDADSLLIAESIVSDIYFILEKITELVQIQVRHITTTYGITIEAKHTNTEAWANTINYLKPFPYGGLVISILNGKSYSELFERFPLPPTFKRYIDIVNKEYGTELIYGIV